MPLNRIDRGIFAAFIAVSAFIFYILWNLLPVMAPSPTDEATLIMFRLLEVLMIFIPLELALIYFLSTIHHQKKPSTHHLKR